MNGNRFLLDTNAIIALLQRNQQLIQRLKNAEWIGISIISQLEFLAFTGLSRADHRTFDQFLQRVEVIGLHSDQIDLLQLIIQLRQQYRLRLPDAIIASTSPYFDANLILTAWQMFTHRHPSPQSSIRK